MIIPIILSGGSGTRLWPLSTPEIPKQFLPLVSERTLFQETLARLEGLPGLADPIVVCNEAHRFLVAEQLRELGLTAQAIVLEPEGRNTAPAIAVAALLAKKVSDTEEKVSDTFLLVLPADHVIADAAAFRTAVGKAVKAAEAGNLVTFGIVPTHAETGYGYIEAGADAGDWHAVARFVEKPDQDTAERYLATGNFLWNSGMFVFGAQAVLDELGQHVPGIVAACEKAVSQAETDRDFTRLAPAFLESPSDSIDYAVMERTGRAAVVPLDAGWSDVGSWAALYDALDKDRDGNAIFGRAVAESCRNTLIRSECRGIAAIGVEDLVIVETETSVLIMRRDQAQQVKAVSASLDALEPDARESD